MGEGPAGPQLEPPERVPLKAPGAAKKKAGEELIDLTHEGTWAFYIGLLFDGVASLTGHDWWLRTDQQIDLVAKPASRICREQIPTEQLKKLQEKQNVVALLVGLAILVVPPLLAEWSHWRGGAVVQGSSDPEAGDRAGTSPPAAPRRGANRRIFGAATESPPASL